MHCITLHYITLHTDIQTYIHTYISYISYISYIHYITLQYITLRYIALHCIALHYVTLHYITLHTDIQTYIHTYIHIDRYESPISSHCQSFIYVSSLLKRPNMSGITAWHTTSKGREILSRTAVVACGWGVECSPTNHGYP